MATFNVAHIREQGQDMIIVPMDHRFDQQSQNVQRRTIDELQVRSNSAGLRGTVVAVWETAGGHTKFIAPRPWHRFFQGIDLGWVMANVNRQITW